MGLGLPTERRGLTSDKKNGMLIYPAALLSGDHPHLPEADFGGASPKPRAFS